MNLHPCWRADLAAAIDDVGHNQRQSATTRKERDEGRYRCKDALCKDRVFASAAAYDAHILVQWMARRHDPTSVLQDKKAVMAAENVIVGQDERLEPVAVIAIAWDPTQA